MQGELQKRGIFYTYITTLICDVFVLPVLVLSKAEICIGCYNDILLEI